MANTFGAGPRYDVQLVSPGGHTIRCDSGLQLCAQAPLERPVDDVDTVVVSGGNGHEVAAADPGVVRLLVGRDAAPGLHRPVRHLPVAVPRRPVLDRSDAPDPEWRSRWTLRVALVSVTRVTSSPRRSAVLHRWPTALGTAAAGLALIGDPGAGTPAIAVCAAALCCLGAAALGRPWVARAASSAARRPS